MKYFYKKIVLAIVAFCVIFTSINIYAGKCIEGNCDDGYGKYQDDDGSIYEGTWVNGFLEGNGKIIIIDGSIYEGFFKRGKLFGQGFYQDKEKKYIGEFKFDLPWGNGDMTFQNGDHYVGQFVKGNFEGNGIMYYKNGDIYDGQWLHGKKNGKFYIKRIDGRVLYCTFLNDKFEGECKIIYPDGKILYAKATNGKLNGQGKIVYSNGGYQILLLKDDIIIKIIEEKLIEKTKGELNETK